jgi:hypothetical protein
MSEMRTVVQATVSGAKLKSKFSHPTNISLLSYLQHLLPGKAAYVPGL